MQTVIIIIHLLIVLALIGVVLLQRSEGGLGLGGGGSSGGSFLTGRGQANVLTRATAVLAALFFATSLILSIMAHRGAAPKSIFDSSPAGQAPAQAPGSGPGVLEELQRLQQSAPPAAPAVPQSR